MCARTENKALNIVLNILFKLWFMFKTYFSRSIKIANISNKNNADL